MSSIVVWKRDGATVEWNKEEPYTCTFEGRRTKHANRDAAIRAARRRLEKARCTDTEPSSTPSSSQDGEKT